MNTWLKLWTKVTLAARVVLFDLFGDESFTGAGLSSPGGQGAGLELEQAQARLDALAGELSGLAAQHKQIEAGQRRAVEDLANLDARIDKAVMQGQEEQARNLLHERKRADQQMEERARRLAESAQALAEARAGLDGLRRKLAEARRQQAELLAREQSAAVLASLASSRRELARDLNHLQEDLAARAEQAARREDWSAAVNEIERQGKE